MVVCEGVGHAAAGRSCRGGWGRVLAEVGCGSVERARKAAGVGSGAAEGTGEVWQGKGDGGAGGGGWVGGGVGRGRWWVGGDEAEVAAGE